MLFSRFTEDEIRSEARRAIESLERWARNMINETLTSVYGLNFENATIGNEPLISKSVREHACQLMKSEPQRSKRWVDALFLDDIIYILCKPFLFQNHFRIILHEAYPLGNEQLRFSLNSLISTRNALSHSNPISNRQAERAICYSYDFIDCLKEYYTKMGREKVWNVPSVVRAFDSLGHEFRFVSREDLLPDIIRITRPFHVGEMYSVEVEVDPAFNSTDYKIVWSFDQKKLPAETNKKICIQFDKAHIGAVKLLKCAIISNKDWHRNKDSDHDVTFMFSVLPPI